MKSVLSGNLHKNWRTVSPTPRKLPLKPWLSSDPGLAAFTTAGISVSVTDATSGRRWESVTWQERPSTVLRAGTPGAVRWLQGSPAGREELTDCGHCCEAGAGSATCPDCACAPSGWQAVPVGASLSLSPLGCCFPTRRSRPHWPDTQASAPRPNSDRRRTGENAAPCVGLPAPPSLYPAFSPKSLAPSWLPAVVFQLGLGLSQTPTRPL